jgi:hypothetical protein
MYAGYVCKVLLTNLTFHSDIQHNPCGFSINNRTFAHVTGDGGEGSAWHGVAVPPHLLFVVVWHLHYTVPPHLLFASTLWD